MTHTPQTRLSRLGPDAKGTLYVRSDAEGHDLGDVAAFYAGGNDATANAKLFLAAPDLLRAQTMGAQVNTPDFLDWIADRLVKVHGENPNVDYVLSLRDRAKAGRAAITQAEGGTP